LLAAPSADPVVKGVWDLSTANSLEHVHTFFHDLSVGKRLDPAGIRAAEKEGQDRLVKVGVPVQDQVGGVLVVLSRQTHEVGLLPEHARERQDALVEQAGAELLNGLLLGRR
jgi:hypothetical protein